LSVISQPTCAIVELNAIVKIYKYKGLHEGHHFILMAMEVHGAFKCNINHFNDLYPQYRLGGHLSLSFCIQFFKQHVSIALQCALASAIERKIALASDVCSKHPIYY